MLLPKPLCLGVFVLVLASYSLQSELAQYIQKTYAKPYFLLYCTHSGYTLIAPLHLLALRVLGIDRRALWQRVHEAISEQCDLRAASTGWAAPDTGDALKEAAPPTRTPWRVLWPAYVQMVLVITVSITVPALCWFCAVPLTSITDVTALYNSNAFWAFLLSIYLTRTERMEPTKGLAVVLAVVGVFVIAYGDARAANAEDAGDGEAVSVGGRLTGSLLALAGSMTYALYEVYYSRFVALGGMATPDVPLVTGATAATTLGHSRSASGRHLMSSPRRGRGYSGVPTDDDGSPESIEVQPRSPGASFGHAQCDRAGLAAAQMSDQAVYLAYADLVTASIGACTVAVLWLPLPVLHWLGIETFELPPLGVVPSILGVVLGGVTYNAGFMILLGQWGPIVASVGNLCTLVLVAAADVLLVGAQLTLPTLVGSAAIVGAFAVLAADTLRG